MTVPGGDLGSYAHKSVNGLLCMSKGVKGRCPETSRMTVRNHDDLSI
jgi:hypothetical protein